jgi:hypothetical protein
MKKDSVKHVKLLTDKQSECVLLQKNLGELLHKYKDRVTAFNMDGQRADVHFTKMQELFNESEQTVVSQEANIVQLEHQNRDATQLIVSLEEKTRQYVDISHKKEMDLVHIKEELMKGISFNL